jgi:hypothetical protein
MDEESFRREYTAFRETGRMMSAWRESAVHRKTAEGFQKETSGLIFSCKG